jgi:hypothetical protein
VRLQYAAAALRAVLDPLEYTEELPHAAHEQSFFVDLDPSSGGRREHDMVAGLHRHLHADLLPPFEPRSDRQHDPVLWRRLVRALRDEQAGAPNPIGVQLFDHDSIEQWAKLVAHCQ